MTDFVQDPVEAPGFSRPVRVTDLPRNRTYAFDVTLSPEELAEMAADLGIVSLKKLKFAGEVAFDDQGDLVLDATLGVTATQSCVVTLDPVRTRIDETVRRRFTSKDMTREEEHQMLEDEDENTDPLGPVIDLGLIASESIALNLPDFPRADGAQLGSRVFTEPGVAPLSDDDVKPFAGLAALKDKLEKKN